MPFRLLIIVVFTLVPGIVFSQGILSGFMQGAGTASISAAYSTESYDHYWSGTNLTDNPQLGTIQTISANLYAAMGLTDWVDVVVNVPWVSASSSAGLWETVSGLQNYSIYVRVRPLHFNIDSSNTLDVMAGAGVNGPMSDYPNNSPVTIGHGNSSFDGKILVQARNMDLNLIVMAAGGYVANAAVAIDWGYDVVVPDVLETTFRIGWTGPVYLDAWIHNVVSQTGTDIGAGVPFPTNKIDYLKVGGTAAYQLPFMKDFTIYAGVASVLTGRNVGKSFGLRAGFSYNVSFWSN